MRVTHLSLLVLVACGSGTEHSGSLPPVDPPPAQPTARLTVTPACIALGGGVTVAWSSTAATACTASGAWTGAKGTSGNAESTPAATGLAFYTMTCSGAGGTATARASVDVSAAGTVPVPRTSYEAKALAGEALGAQLLPAEVHFGNAVAFGDFFQDGSYAMVTHSLEYDPQDKGTATRFGHIRFYRRDGGGGWVDGTSSLLTDTVGCLHPRKAAVTDLNGDGRPDVVFACHGFDAPPFPGEAPHVLLSRTDGTYSNTKLPISGFIHSVSAGDVNGDGYPDLLVTDNVVAGQPYFLMNDGGGTFTQDLTRLPSSLRWEPIFTAELIDFDGDGRLDAFLAGHEQDPANAAPATIFLNEGGRYLAGTPKVLPAPTGYGFALDVVFTAGNVYLARTVDEAAHFYQGAAIQRVSYPALVGETLYTHSGAYSSGTTWINWIVPHGSSVATLDSMYDVSVAQ